MYIIKVLVHGALGKMGQEICQAVSSDPELDLVSAVDIRAHTANLVLPNNVSVLLYDNLDTAINDSKPDVMVDFSTADATMSAVRSAVNNDVRLVIGTTGLSNADNEEIARLCMAQNLGAVIAANFSLAAAVMISCAKIASQHFDYAEIIELHHEKKLDAPSGTAISTAKAMTVSRGKDFTYALSPNEEIAGSRGGVLGGIAMHSVRLPGQLAHQEIIFGSPGQTLRIRLDQISREAFMPSIVMAVKKTMELKEAIFGLDRLLGL